MGIISCPGITQVVWTHRAWWQAGTSGVVVVAGFTRALVALGFLLDSFRTRFCRVAVCACRHWQSRQRSLVTTSALVVEPLQGVFSALSRGVGGEQPLSYLKPVLVRGILGVMTGLLVVDVLSMLLRLLLPS